MSYSNLIRLWGGLDVFYVLWVIYADLVTGKIPFLSSLVDATVASWRFGLLSIATVTFVGSLVTLTVIASGVLMLMLRKQGVYISLFQAPFRMFLVIPSTLFFVFNIVYDFSISSWLIWGGVIFIEAFKITTEVIWLRMNPPGYIGGDLT